MAEDKKNELEKEYTIPLRNKWNRVPRYKRAKKAIRTIREFLVRHMKIRDGDLNKIKIDKYLNEQIWNRGIKKPPAKIKVKAVKNSETGNVVVELFELPEKLKFKKAREDKFEQKSMEVAESKKKTQEEQKQEEKPDEKKEEETKEKEKTSAQETMKLEKQAAKRTKHQTKQDKRPKHQFRKALAK